MAAPGSREARYLALTGGRDGVRELFVARRYLRFSIDEWRALPWWHRRAYLEGFNIEAEDAADARDDAQDHAQAPRTGAQGVDALLYGTLADVRDSTEFSAG